MTNKTTWHFIKVNTAAMVAIQRTKADRLEKGERLKTDEIASELILRGVNA
jgi:hypothetical protein